MRAVTKDGFRSLLYLISLVVGVATAGVLVGVGFSWLTDPPLATQTAGPILSAQALKENEFRLPRGNGTAGGSAPRYPCRKGGGEFTSRRAVQLGRTGVGDASDEGETHPVRRNHPGQKGAGRSASLSRNSEILGGLMAT